MIRSRTGVISIGLTLLITLALAAPAVAQDATAAKPFIWPTTGRITQPFGCTGFWAEPSYGSCRHFHGGIDIANSEGTPILAAADGVISHVGWYPWGTHNWMVMINHGDGLTTWYAHLRGRQIDDIRVGVHVFQGQVIGYMSNTGMATGVHLHWAVLKYGRYVNPRHYVDGKPYRSSGNAGRGTTSCRDIVIAAGPGAVTAAVLPGADGGGDSKVSCSTA